MMIPTIVIKMMLTISANDNVRCEPPETVADSMRTCGRNAACRRTQGRGTESAHSCGCHLHAIYGDCHSQDHLQVSHVPGFARI